MAFETCKERWGPQLPCAEEKQTLEDIYSCTGHCTTNVISLCSTCSICVDDTSMMLVLQRRNTVAPIFSLATAEVMDKNFSMQPLSSLSPSVSYPIVSPSPLSPSKTLLY